MMKNNGLINQVNNPKLVDNKLTVEKLKTIVNDIFNNEKYKDIFPFKSTNLIPYVKENSIDLDDLPTGYLFKFGYIMTGKGGAENIVKSLREKGSNDTFIANNLEMTLTEGLRTDTIFYPIVMFKEKKNVK